MIALHQVVGGMNISLIFLVCSCAECFKASNNKQHNSREKQIVAFASVCVCMCTLCVMEDNQLVSSAMMIKSTNVRESALVSANYNKISDNIRRLAPHGLQCTMFCGGTNCKYENPDNWTSSDYAIQGIFSNWVTDDILAMARPSTSILIKKNVIQQFHSWGIKSIINLQTPKEHASCGPPLEESGYTYDPTIFMENDIYYYNFTWKDYGDATLQGLLNMVKVLAFAVKEGRVAIHCHAGLGRTGVLIACYLVYILRVRANDAINYIRLKRPGSVQTRGQILCIQEFAQYILPLSIVYNIKETQMKDKKTHELSLSKCLHNQRIILHGYEERSLKHLPKIVYRICERILVLCNCWCDEFAVGNVAFTNHFLVTKLNFQNRKNSYVYAGTGNTGHTGHTGSTLNMETGSQYTLSNASATASGKEISTPTATCDTARSSAELSVGWREIDDVDVDDDGDQSTRLSTNASTSSDCVELLNEIHHEMVDENLRENKCFQLLTQLQCGSAHAIAEPYTTEEVAAALLTDHNTLEEQTKKYLKQFEMDFNCSQTTWSRLKTEKNLVVLSGLLYDWLESLKNPIVNREDLSNIVIYNKRPETCLQKLNIDSQYLLEFLIRFLTHLQPSVTGTTLNILKRFAASITQKTVMLKNVRMPVGKGFQKLRDGTLECVLNFMFSLYNIFEANRRSSAMSTKFYEVHSAASSEETDDDSDVECPPGPTALKP